MYKFGVQPLPDTVLLIEEDRVLADLVKLSLHRKGFFVEVTRRADEVDKFIDHLNPMIILLDLFLVGTNGLNILEDLKRSGRMNGRRIILISALGFMEVIEQAIKMGAVDFIVKPFDVDLLVEKVIKWSESA